MTFQLLFKTHLIFIKYDLNVSLIMFNIYKTILKHLFKVHLTFIKPALNLSLKLV